MRDGAVCTEQWNKEDEGLVKKIGKYHKEKVAVALTVYTLDDRLIVVVQLRFETFKTRFVELSRRQRLIKQANFAVFSFRNTFQGLFFS